MARLPRHILNLLIIVSMLICTWPLSLAAKARNQGISGIPSYPMSFQWTARIRASKRAKGHSLETAVPVVSSDTVFIGGLGGYFYALDRVSGKTRWSVDTGGGIEGAATLDGGVVYVGNNKGIVSAFKAADGTVLWTYKAPTEIITSPVVYGDALFVSTAADELIRLDTVTGERLESQTLALLEPDITLRGHGNPTAVGNVLLVPLSSGGVVAYDMTARRLLWRQDIRGSYGRFSDSDMAPLVVRGYDSGGGDGKVFIAVYRQGLYALSLATGAVVWKRPWSSQSDFLYHDGRLYLSAVDGEVLCVNPGTGETLWKSKLSDGAAILTNLVLWPVPGGDRRLVVGERSKGLYVLDRESGKILGRHGIGGGVSAMLVSVGDNAGQKSLYFLSNAHQLYSLASGS